MPQQQSKVGAIIALSGGILALIAFFALPLFNFILIQFTAVQAATSLGSLLNSLGGSSSSYSPYGSSSYNSAYSGLSTAFYLLWLAALLPLIVGILGAVILANKPASAAYVPPAGYATGYPPTPYGTTAYGPPPMVPQPPPQPSGAGRGASTAIIVCSIINLLMIIIFYAVISRPFSSYSSTSSSSIYSGTSSNPLGAMSLASFLAIGFWIYALAVLAMLVGGIIQLRASSR